MLELETEEQMAADENGVEEKLPEENVAEGTAVAGAAGAVEGKAAAASQS